ncbi:MAG TPA: hypothetical protein VF745_03085 [Steroidobacteraceae bacterium]
MWSTQSLNSIESIESIPQSGVPLIFVAEALGHSDARMVAKHYGHLAPSHVADAIRAALPKFGPLAQSNMTDMRARKA